MKGNDKYSKIMEKNSNKQPTKDEANVCKNTVSVDFLTYEGAQIPGDETVKVQEFAGNKLKITHTKNIFKVNKKTLCRWIFR